MDVTPDISYVQPARLPQSVPLPHPHLSFYFHLCYHNVWQVPGEAKRYKRSGTDGGGRACMMQQYLHLDVMLDISCDLHGCRNPSHCPIHTLPTIFADATTLCGRYERQTDTRTLEQMAAAVPGSSSGSNIVFWT